MIAFDRKDDLDEDLHVVASVDMGAFFQFIGYSFEERTHDEQIVYRSPPADRWKRAG